MANSYRLFLALWPDDEVCNKLISFLKQPSITSCSGKPVATENLHITLRYIGSVDETTLAAIEEAMARVVFPSFELQLDYQGYWSRPQVAWLGCRKVPEALQQLVADIESTLTSCGIEPESRPYVPHLTFMRKIRQFPAADISPINWPVDSFVLVHSETFPDSVRYTVLKRWP